MYRKFVAKFDKNIQFQDEDDNGKTLITIWVGFKRTTAWAKGAMRLPGLGTSRRIDFAKNFIKFCREQGATRLMGIVQEPVARHYIRFYGMKDTGKRLWDELTKKWVWVVKRDLRDETGGELK